jgi:hypothetical protein
MSMPGWAASEDVRRSGASTHNQTSDQIDRSVSSLSRGGSDRIAVQQELSPGEVGAKAAQRDAALASLARGAERESSELRANRWVLPLDAYRLTGRFGDVSSLTSRLRPEHLSIRLHPVS